MHVSKMKDRMLKSVLFPVVALAAACVPRPATNDSAPTTTAGQTAAETTAPAARVRPGITVLLEDSIHLIRNRRIALITNQTGLDEHGRTDIDLLFSGDRARAAAARLVSLYSPEHGIRGTEDRAVDSSVDERTGLMIHSLYTAGTTGPADSTLAGVDALVFDLQDIGTRTWTYVGVMVYSLRSAKRNDIPIIVLDRPNPITGLYPSPPMLSASLANPEDPTPEKRGLAFALFPFPLRHGMTMGEMALFYNDSLKIGARLHVIPAAGWRRSMWFDQTGLKWVKPSPNLPTLEGALLYPALVALEGTNVSVGRGTPRAHRVFGAPALDAKRVVQLLEERRLSGVRFVETTFQANRYGTQQPYGGETIPGVEIVITDRDRVQVGRLGAAIYWALKKTYGDSLKVNELRFDRLFGEPSAREALLRGEDPDAVIDRMMPDVADFERRMRKYLLYR